MDFKALYILHMLIAFDGSNVSDVERHMTGSHHLSNGRMRLSTSSGTEHSQKLCLFERGGGAGVKWERIRLQVQKGMNEDSRERKVHFG